MSENSKNRKLLIVCVFILGIITIGATIFLFAVRLEKPLFLKSYLEYNSYNEDYQQFTLQYLSNSDDSRTVNGIEFLDIKNGRFSSFATELYNDGDFLFTNQGNEQSSTVQNLGIYSLHTVRVTVQQSAKNLDDYIVLENAKIHYSDGSSQEIFIGEVILNWNLDQKHPKLHQIMAQGSNDGTSTEIFKSEDDFTLVDIQLSPSVKAEGLFQLTINGVDALSNEIKGLKIANGSDLTIQTNFPEPNNLKEKFTTYEISAILTLKDNNGVEWNESVFIHYKPTTFGFGDILRYNLSQHEK